MSGTEQRDGYRSSEAKRDTDRRGDERRNERRDDRRSYCPLTCFSCGESGHYANQCLDRDRRRYNTERPSTSSDSRHSGPPRRYDPRRRYDSPPHDGGEIKSTVTELGKSVAAMKDFFDEARLKKEEKERRKREKKEAEAREAEERERLEKKAKKKAEKCKRELELEAQRREELRKDNDIHLAIRLSEMEENFAHKVDSIIGPLRELMKHGKKKVTYDEKSESTSDEESDTSVTQELSARTEQLHISEKRKRGPGPEFDDSPPIELPLKRTPKKGALKPTRLIGRMTRARTTVKAPGSVKRISPRICKEEGVPYDGKIDAIFAIADNRAKEKYGLDSVDATEVIALEDNETTYAEQRKDVRIFVEGGNLWQSGWKRICKAFGDAKLKVGGNTVYLKQAKLALQQGGEFQVVHWWKWKPRCRYFKYLLIQILRDPRKLEDLYRWNIKSLLRLYYVVKDFSRNSTRKYLRRLISKIFSSRFDLCMGSDPVFRLKFDDRIKVVEVRKVLNDALMRGDLPRCFLQRMRKKVQIVWVKNPSIADTMHNHRAFAAQNELTCKCARLSFPKSEGHVRFRVSSMEDVHPLLRNTRNMPRVTTDWVCYKRRSRRDFDSVGIGKETCLWCRGKNLPGL
ncbi:hypothetical protein CBR_g37472 [Chara braunii]|uniref:CCHC-type domain-containing protein n=1 Tax=Chara braunii TaxID=69332 RepID=A0A388LMV2_CHABU|nr:hypothetical protein CBR_g37472 [Chara braunii]|eukprot:GBG83670.1 hypothetical protein CBR_g37472 [Chara braunii]